MAKRYIETFDFPDSSTAFTTSWTDWTANLAIASNSLKNIAAGLAAAVYAYTLDTADHGVTLLVGTVDADTSFNIKIRGDGGNNWIILSCHQGGNWEISTYISPTAVSRATATGTTTAAAGGIIKFTAVGTTYTAYYNGAQVVQWADVGGAYTNYSAFHSVDVEIDDPTTAARTITAAIIEDIPGPSLCICDAASATYPSGSTTRSPSLTFSTLWTPVENQIVVMFPSSTGTDVTIIDDASSGGWINLSGSTVDVESDSHELSGMYHKITAAEAAAVQRTYTATNWFSVAQVGAVLGCVISGVDPTVPLDLANSWFNSSNSTTHVLASLAGASLSTGSIVISSVAKDIAGAYETLPTGWKWLTTNNAVHGRALLVRDALTTAGVDVAATNITAGGSDEGASITAAFTAYVPPAPAPTNFFQMF